MASFVETGLLQALEKVKAEVLRHYPSGSDQYRAYEALLIILEVTVLDINRIAEALKPRDRGGPL